MDMCKDMNESSKIEGKWHDMRLRSIDHRHPHQLFTSELVISKLFLLNISKKI